MNLIAVSPLWLTIILLAALLAAAVEDAMRLRISNVTCLAVLLSALTAMGVQGLPIALWQNAVVFIAILALGTPLFAAGKMGGGDIKLLACLGLWMNFSAAVWLLASTMIAGGLLACGFIAVRLLRSRGDAPKRKLGSGRIPYGLAIAAGACLVFAGQLGMLQQKPQKSDPFSMAPYLKQKS
ncbi:prepilin peptidase CpaA [Sphingomonas sp. F9_3S_D5_B_2]